MTSDRLLIERDYLMKNTKGMFAGEFKHRLAQNVIDITIFKEMLEDLAFKDDNDNYVIDRDEMIDKLNEALKR